LPVLTPAALRDLTAAIFRATGAPDDLAAQVADVLVDNHLAGHDSHGILRIPEYVESIRRGEIVPVARPKVLDESPTSALISGNWAFGQVTAIYAADLAIAKAPSRKPSARVSRRFPSCRPATLGDWRPLPSEPPGETS
jgi:hydroxycarboxylate dehydrogenase B